MNDITAITTEHSQTNKAVLSLAFIPLTLLSLLHTHVALAAGIMVIYVILMIWGSNTLLLDKIHLLRKTIPIEPKSPP